MEEVMTLEQITAHISLPISCLAALSALVIGAIWYHEKVFGGVWMKALGKSEKELSSGNMALIFGLAYLMSVILAHFIQIFIEFMHWHPEHGGGPGTTHSLHTFKHGAFHGFFLALLMIMPVIVIKALFERFNWKYVLVHVGYWIITFMVIGGIVDTW